MSFNDDDVYVYELATLRVVRVAYGALGRMLLDNPGLGAARGFKAKWMGLQQ